MKNTKIIALLLLTASLMGACGSVSKKTSGTAAGAAAGAAVGQLIGKNTEGTLIGAGVGALAGLGWGAYKDAQYKEFTKALQNTNVSILNGEKELVLRLPAESSFNSGSAILNSGFYGPLTTICNILNKYPETNVRIAGYTDSTGSVELNNNLSYQRAQNVGNYLASQGVDPSRITTVGYGSKNPIGSNSTPEGKALNRRVEIILTAAK